VIGGQAHFCQIPSVNQGWDAIYLENLAATAPDAIHVVIRDQAGFHLRDGDPRLSNRVRIIDLPPYWPELNPCEQLWDIIKDEIGNRVFLHPGASQGHPPGAPTLLAGSRLRPSPRWTRLAPRSSKRYEQISCVILI
jgi:hypothetical protein